MNKTFDQVFRNAYQEQVLKIFPGNQIALTRMGSNEISTVELPRMPGDDRRVWETCIFPDQGHSEVVARYNSAEEAALGHADIIAAVAKKQQPYR